MSLKVEPVKFFSVTEWLVRVISVTEWLVRVISVNEEPGFLGDRMVGEEDSIDADGNRSDCPLVYGDS